MEPLIKQFTKNLKPCSWCGNGNAVYETWAEAKKKGEKMTFVFEVAVDADNYKQAVGKVPDEFEILKGTTKPDRQTQGGPQLPSVPTNMRTGLPVQG